MEQPTTFGDWLRARRRARDLTREALAELVSCAPPTLAKIEQGTRRPSRELAALLVAAFQPPPAERERALALARQPLGAHPAGPPLGDEAAEHLAMLPPLPAVPSPLVGRQGELRLLGEHLADPACRVVTLTGPGGVGKTRLALQAAHAYAPGFPGGVAWAELAAAPDVAAAARAIAEAAGCPPRGDEPPERRLLARLRDARLLLVADNLEHLPDSAPLLTAILREAPGVTLLLTSRERTRLPGEWVLAIDGLAVPAPGAEGEFERFDAARLFLERARQADAAFAPDGEGRAAVAQICRLVDGVPLAIELAAAWVRALSCVEIAAELARGPALLAAPDGAARRHGSMQAVFEQSWRLLAPEERRCLAALSVFSGGFTRDAAAQVAGAPLGVLAALIEKSLLRRREEGGHSRYHMHEQVRQWAAERLGASDAALREAHARYFAGVLAESVPQFQGGGQLAALARLDPERANIAAAWAWAVARGDGATMQRCAPALLLMHELRGQLREAAALFAGATASRRALQVAGQGPDRILGVLCAWEGWARGRYGEVAAAQQLLAEAITLLDGADDMLAATGAPGSLGLLLLLRGRYPEARAALERSLALVAPRGLGFFVTLHTVFLLNVGLAEGAVADALALGEAAVARAEGGGQRARLLTRCGLALAACRAGDPGRAQGLARAALALAVEAHDPFGLGLALLMLGNAARLLGESDEARYLLVESAETCAAVGDRWNQGRALVQLGALELDAGDPAAAWRAWREALAVTLAHGIDGVAATAAVELAALAAAGAHVLPQAQDAARGLLAALWSRPELDAAARARALAVAPELVALPSPLDEAPPLAALLARYPAICPPRAAGAPEG